MSGSERLRPGPTAPRAAKSGLRRLGGALAPTVGEGGAAARAAARLAGADLSGGPGRAPISAFWTVDTFTGEIDRTWTLVNFQTIFASETYRWIALRTILMAAAVTIADVLLAFPFAYYMARVAGAERAALFVRRAAAVVVLSGARLRLAADLRPRRDAELDAGRWRPAGQIATPTGPMFVVFCYLWLPFMILPIFAAIERIPPSLIEASQDLGGRAGAPSGWSPPLVLPGVVAGSIFTFSLTLGDYITPVLMGGPARTSSATSSSQRRHLQQRAVRRGDGPHPDGHHGRLSAGARALGAFKAPRWSRAASDRAADLGRAGAGVPLRPDHLIMLYAFDRRSSRAGRSPVSRSAGSPHRHDAQVHAALSCRSRSRWRRRPSRWCWARRSPSRCTTSRSSAGSRSRSW